MLNALTTYLGGEGEMPLGLVFHAPIPFWLCLLLLIFVAIGSIGYYRKQLSNAHPRMRFILLCLRTTVLLLVMTLLMDPSILIQRITPGDQVVVLVFDDSMSMRIDAKGARSRGATLLAENERQGDTLEAALSERHRVVRYRLGDDVQPLSTVESLDFSQRESLLVNGIERIQDDLAGMNISAIVLFSDGVEQGVSNAIAESLNEHVPVFTVGIGELNAWRDLELEQLHVQNSDFSDRPIALNAHVGSNGLKGQSAVLQLNVGDKLVKEKRFVVSESKQTIRMEWTPDENDWTHYSVSVHLSDDSILEHIEDNNTGEFLLDHRKKEYRVLYVSGRPNWQHTFIHRALEDDEESRLSSLIYISIAEPKFNFRENGSSFSNPLFEGFADDPDRPRYDEAVFIRLGMEPDELASGFPERAQDLFSYDVLIFGDAERDYFSDKQLNLVRDFVDKRGGAFLMLGGIHSFGQGGYEGSPLDSILPVLQYSQSRSDEDAFVRDLYQVSPTMRGNLSGMWSLNGGASGAPLDWEEMPSLYGMNQFPLTRIGATVMSETDLDSVGGRSIPLFSYQRYGEGTSAVLATGDTWQWQMQLPEENDQHERLWRQITRYLSNQVLDPIAWHVDKERYTVWNTIPLRFTIRNDAYEKQESLYVTVELISPKGDVIQLGLDESLSETGVYESSYIPEEAGLYALNLIARDADGQHVGMKEERILVEKDTREYLNARFDRDHLESISAHTGGEYVALSKLNELPELIPTPINEDPEEYVLHLWHVPAFYGLIVLLLAIEWVLRRKRGFA